MTFSANGAKIMSGAGVAAVRKKIEDAFEKCRDVPTHIRTNSAETRIETVELEETEVTVVLEVKQTELVQRTLEAKARLYVRAAEKHIQHIAARRHHGGMYQISVPVEDAVTLIDQALRSFD